MRAHAALPGWRWFSWPAPHFLALRGNAKLSSSRLMQFLTHIRSHKKSRGGARFSWIAGIWLLSLGIVAAAPGETTTLRPAPAHERTALDRYVAAPDTNFTFRLVRTARTPLGEVHLLEMTSQVYLTPREVDRPLWQHWIYVIMPKEIRGNTALLFLGGGNNRKDPPGSPNGTLTEIALATRSVVAELRNVPNQPLIFHQDGQERREDDLIAYTWEQFLRTGEEHWPARLPMTKAAVRAMDAVTAFCGGLEAGGVKIENYFVAGASKRGWTTWTTAAVDARVIGLAPIVIDVLNMEVSMAHHYAAYGFWSPAVGDYVRHGIMDWMGTPEFKALFQIEDPYAYRHRFTQPKLIVNASGDQFFLPDSSQFYFHELPGPKYLRYVPNADHSLKGSDAWQTVQAFYEAVRLNKPLPRFDWTFPGDSAIQVRATDPPQAVTLWQATNPEARDFRLATFGPKWTSRPLSLDGDRCLARVTMPPKGWTAFFVELTYAGPGEYPLKFTTAVRVVPDRTDHQFKPQRPPAAKR